MSTFEKDEAGSAPDNSPGDSNLDTQTPATTALPNIWLCCFNRVSDGHSPDCLRTAEVKRAEADYQKRQRPEAYCIDCGVKLKGSGATDRSMLDPNICWECGEGQF